MSKIESMWDAEEPEDEEYAEIVTHFVTLLALGEDHSFPAELQDNIHGSAKWLQKIFAEVPAEKKTVQRIKDMCETS